MAFEFRRKKNVEKCYLYFLSYICKNDIYVYMRKNRMKKGMHV